MRTHIGLALLRHVRRQYMYSYTSKASKLGVLRYLFFLAHLPRTRKVLSFFFVLRFFFSLSAAHDFDAERESF
jgi:hypothetical protein